MQCVSMEEFLIKQLITNKENNGSGKLQGQEKL